MKIKTALKKFLYPSTSSIWHAMAIVYSFSVISLFPTVYALLLLFAGVLLLRFDLLAVLLGAMIPYVFPSLLPLFATGEGSSFWIGFAMLNAGLYVLFWIIFYKRAEKSAETERKAVFLDPTGIRWSLLKRSTIVLITLCLAISTVLLMNLLQIPTLTQPKNLQTLAVPFVFQAGLREAGLYGTDDTKELYAYIKTDDPEGEQSFANHIESIHTLLPHWFQFSEGARLEDHSEENLLELAKQHHVEILPILSDFPDGWKDPHMAANLEVEHARAQLALNLLVQVSKYQVNGITFDFLNFPNDPKFHKNFLKLIKELHELFQPFHLKIAVTVYPGRTDAENIKQLEPYVHRFIAVTDGLGQGDLGKWKIPSEKLIIRLENYATTEGTTLSFMDAINRSWEQQTSITWGEKGQPVFHYTQGDHVHHFRLFDAATLYNQIHGSLSFIPKGYALNRLGTEDPSSWNVLAHLFRQEPLNLTRIEVPGDIRMMGEGEILKLYSQSQEGKRDLQIDSTGKIIDVRYLQLPFAFQIQRAGKTNEKVVALTFSDGPHPVFTEQILDILQQYKVPATFFLIGTNASMNQSLVQRMVKEGHVIGNATFSIAKETDLQRLKLELHANQRFIEGITGYSTRLFSPPPNLRIEPNWNKMMEIVHELEYSLVEGAIDPRDTQHPSPSPEEIVQRIIRNTQKGHIISLHDGGEQRENTVNALPIIIETLQSKGYRFAPISELMGSTPQQVMPIVTAQTKWINDQLAFLAAPAVHRFFTVVFYGSIILGILRLLLLCVFAYSQRKKQKTIPTKSSPFVSVVLAAYNEEKIIQKTLESILESTYPQFEIIVVNDGSVDGTRDRVLEMSKLDPRIRLIDQENQGKSYAINRGFQASHGDIIVSIDADTQVLPQAIEWLVRPFEHPEVAAVSGNVKVGNLKNRLTMWQHMEYVASFNLDRRAFSLIRSVPVVPGAIGAWRKEDVERAGFFSHDTLAEDTDMTLKLLREGKRVYYEERALAYTEAPDEFRSFVKQRFRWVYGTLQCVWKHRDTIF